jgi:hypothetical protein
VSFAESIQDKCVSCKKLIECKEKKIKFKYEHFPSFLHWSNLNKRVKENYYIRYWEGDQNMTMKCEITEFQAQSSNCKVKCVLFQNLKQTEKKKSIVKLQSKRTQRFISKVVQRELETFHWLWALLATNLEFVVDVLHKWDQMKHAKISFEPYELLLEPPVHQNITSTQQTLETSIFIFWKMLINMYIYK